MTSSAPEGTTGGEAEYVTVTAGGHMFGLPIGRIQDVFLVSAVTPVPLAGPEVVGLLNLRGRVVTALSLRRRLGLDRQDPPETMAVGFDRSGDAYALFVEGVGEVLRLRDEMREPVPVHLDPRWAALTTCVYRLEKELLIILDVEAVLGLGETARAA